MFLDRIAARIQTLAWGNQAYQYSSKRKDIKKDPYKEAMKALNDKKSEVANEAAEKTEHAPQELQEGLQKIVNKSRSKYERSSSIPKISDQTFLFQTAMNEKQNEQVRREAAAYVKDQALVEKLAEQTQEFIKFPAIKNLTDPKLILKYAEEGIAAAIRKVDNEDTLTKLILKFGNPKRNYHHIRDNVFDDEDMAEAVRTKIKKEDNLRKIIDIRLQQNDKEDADARGGMPSTLLEIAKKSKDPKVLEKILSIPEVGSYGYDEHRKPYQRIALIKLKDKAVAKKVALDPAMSEGVRQVALKIADDSGLYEKAFEKDPEFTEALEHIDNEAFLKKMYKALLTRERPKENNYDEKDRYSVDDLLSKIKDEAFLKKIIETDTGNQQAALNGVHDQKYLKELLDKKEKGDKTLEKISNADIISQLTDQKILKEYYEAAKEESNKAREKHKEGQTGYRKRRFSLDPSEGIRKAAINNIKDNAYLLKVYRGDKDSYVRKHALSLIDDPKILTELFIKEKRKSEKNMLLEELKDNEALMVELLTSGKLDSEYENWVAQHIKSPEVAKKNILDNLHDSNAIYNKMIELVSNDQDFLKKVMNNPKAQTTLKGRLFHFVDDPVFLMKFYKDNEVFFKGSSDDNNILLSHLIEKTEDIDFLFNFVKTSTSYNTSSALEKVLRKATPEMLVDLAMHAKSGEVRKVTIPHIKDINLLKKVAMEDPVNARDLLPHFKDDKNFLGKLLLKSKDPKVRANLVRRVKDQDVLKEVAKTSGELAPLALHSITDEKYLKEILLHTQSFAVAESILGNPNLPIADVKEFALKSKWNVGGSYGRGGELATTVWKRLLAHKEITISDLDKLSDIPTTNVDIIFALIKELENTNEVGMLQHIVLTSSNPRYATKAFKAVRNPEFAETVMQKAKDPEVQKDALLWIAPDGLTPNRVADFIEGLDNTDEPGAVSLDLKHKAYMIGTEDEQDALAKRLPDRLLNERHKKEMSEEDTHYLKPRTSYRDQKGIIKKADHPVVELPQQELLRLLVGLSR